MSEEDFESDQANLPCKSPNSISNNFDTIYVSSLLVVNVIQISGYLMR